MALPGLPQSGDQRELPEVRRRLGGLERVEEGKAILPHHLRIGVATGLALRQARILDPLAVALIPREGRHRLQPGGGDGRQFVERSPEGFRHQFEAIHHTDGREHMRRVGALLAPCFERVPWSDTAPAAYLTGGLRRCRPGGGREIH